ncbi:MAG: hypothetical protein HYY00_01175 [Chloroflexi bacterium]|nr:hypothetical protein [Chloroflexota bacterium]
MPAKAKKGTGLLMVWADVPADKEEEFNRWYNEEHIGDLLAIPGVLSAARYVAVKGGPKYLAYYELESPAVWDSEAFQKFRNNPSPWAKRMSPRVIGTTYINNVYRLIFPSSLPQAFAATGPSPALQMGRMDVSPQAEDEFNKWYNTVYIPGYEKVPGCIKGRRYVAVRGQPKYFTLYDFQHENVPNSPEWQKARDANPQSRQIRDTVMRHGPGSPGVYKLVFPK